jgi:hypothetical protein
MQDVDGVVPQLLLCDSTALALKIGDPTYNLRQWKLPFFVPTPAVIGRFTVNCYNISGWPERAAKIVPADVQPLAIPVMTTAAAHSSSLFDQYIISYSLPGQPRAFIHFYRSNFYYGTISPASSKLPRMKDCWRCIVRGAIAVEIFHKKLQVSHLTTPLQNQIVA